MWLLSVPVLFVAEVIYLIRHPRTFSGLAALIGLFIVGVSYLFAYRGDPPAVVYITQVVGVFTYYGIKLHR